MKKNKTLTILIMFFIFLSACQNVKDALSGNKQDNSDEFLIQKKNPLVLPPEFSELPEPDSIKKNEIEEENEIENLFGIYSAENEDKSPKDTGSKSTEQFILKNINKN